MTATAPRADRWKRAQERQRRRARIRARTAELEAWGDPYRDRDELEAARKRQAEKELDRQPLALATVYRSRRRRLHRLQQQADASIERALDDARERLRRDGARDNWTGISSALHGPPDMPWGVVRELSPEEIEREAQAEVHPRREWWRKRRAGFLRRPFDAPECGLDAMVYQCGSELGIGDPGPVAEATDGSGPFFAGPKPVLCGQRVAFARRCDQRALCERCAGLRKSRDFTTAVDACLRAWELQRSSNAYGWGLSWKLLSLTVELRDGDTFETRFRRLRQGVPRFRRWLRGYIRGFGYRTGARDIRRNQTRAIGDGIACFLAWLGGRPWVPEPPPSKRPPKAIRYVLSDERDERGRRIKVPAEGQAAKVPRGAYAGFKGAELLSYEVTAGSFRQGHPHAHMMALAPWLDMEQVEAAAKRFGLGFTDIRFVTKRGIRRRSNAQGQRLIPMALESREARVKAGVAEVLKYVSKPPINCAPEEAADLTEKIDSAIYMRRLTERTGLLRHPEVYRPRVYRCPCCGDVRSMKLEEIARWTITRDKRAVVPITVWMHSPPRGSPGGPTSTMPGLKRAGAIVQWIPVGGALALWRSSSETRAKRSTRAAAAAQLSLSRVSQSAG